MFCEFFFDEGWNIKQKLALKISTQIKRKKSSPENLSEDIKNVFKFKLRMCYKYFSTKVQLHTSGQIFRVRFLFIYLFIFLDTRPNRKDACELATTHRTTPHTPQTR